MDRDSLYRREIARGYKWWSYPDFYTWLATQAREVVEVGCWKGFSTSHLAHQLKLRPDGGWLYAVDVWDRKGGYWKDFVSRFPEEAADHLYACFLAHLRHEGIADVVLPYRMPSIEAARLFKIAGRSFDAVFVDGDHSESAVRADITAWKPLVRPGGILCGHDYSNRHVRAAVDAMLPTIKLEAGDVWWVRTAA